MLRRFGSIRNIVLLSTLAVAVVGLVLSYFIATTIEQRAQLAATNNDLSTISTAAYQSLHQPNALERLRLLAQVNPGVGITISQGTAQVFVDLAPSHGGLEISHLFRRGNTVIRTYVRADDLAPVSAEVTAISGVLSILIIISGLITGTLLTKSLKGPVEEVVQAAEKIASGDLSARISPTGPEEITKLAVAFDFMAQHLEESEGEKRRFLSDLAHEIATPLNSISGFALALSDGTISSPNHRAEIVTIIESETLRIKTLLGDLRNLETLDLSYPSVHQVVNIKAYFTELLLRFTPQIQEKDLQVKTECSRISISLDKRLLDLVMQNFLTNAIRYVDRQGTIVLHAKESQHHEVVIGVRDDGIGIAPEHLSLIFDRLYRVDAARDRVSGGSGLGLSIAQRASLNLGGRIEVSSVLSQGSDFRLILPKLDATKRSKASQFSPKQSPGPDVTTA